MEEPGLQTLPFHRKCHHSAAWHSSTFIHRGRGVSFMSHSYFMSHFVQIHPFLAEILVSGMYIWMKTWCCFWTCSTSFIIQQSQGRRVFSFYFSLNLQILCEAFDIHYQQHDIVSSTVFCLSCHCQTCWWGTWLFIIHQWNTNSETLTWVCHLRDAV